MTWDIIAGLIVLVGTCISMGTVLAKLIRTITTLDVTLKNLQNNIDKENDSNHKTHERIFEKIENHEGRIVSLENHDREV